MTPAIPRTSRRRTPIVRWWVNLPIRMKGLLVIALPLTAIALTIVVRQPITRQQQQTIALVWTTAETRDLINSLRLAVIDCENSARAFLLTRDPSYLTPYVAAKRRIPELATRVDARLAGRDRETFDRLSGLIRQRVEQTAGLLGDIESGAAPATVPPQTIADGRAAMDAIRVEFDRLLASQHALAEQSAAELRSLRETLGPIAAVTLLGGLAGAVLAMWLFATGIAGRIQALEHNANRLAQGERLRFEPSRGEDEIGSLDLAVRRASLMLRTRDRELRSLNSALERSLHDQTLLNRELEAFSYSVSHDLRAPLRSIDGFAQALREDWGDRLDETGQDQLARVRNAAQRMGRLIDDLLKLARLTRAQLQRVDVDLSRLAHEIAAELRERNPSRDVTWDIQEGLHADCDPTLTRVLLDNLLGNAWKFTSKTTGARIQFHALPDTRPTTFVVRDNGAGFDMKYVEKLFGPFQRLHGEREFPGTGIGLATVQRIVHKHGGEVRTTGDVGKGAAFYFTLAPADGTAAQVA